MTQPLLRALGLSKTYVQRCLWSRAKFLVQALDKVNFTVLAGSTVAVVGESGSGKSTLARCLVALEQPTAGEVWFNGRNLFSLEAEELRGVRRQMQLIFQDTATALNPHFTAEEIITEPLRIQRIGERAAQRKQAAGLMEVVGLPSAWLGRRAHQFSGGQRQRLAIARALALRPCLLVLDEALAGLDLSVQAQIMNLLQDLQKAHHLTCLYISHDLGLMGEIAGEIAVMHEGKVVERGTARDLLTSPRHARTVTLLEAIPGRSLSGSA